MKIKKTLLSLLTVATISVISSINSTVFAAETPFNNTSRQWTYGYNGSYQSRTLDPGKYKLEAWGAGGGYGSNSYTAEGGRGAYASGILDLKERTTIYIYVGGGGRNGSSSSSYSGGYNGGGYGYYYSGGGGGATDFSLKNGSWNDINRLNSRILVAAGGGGGSSYSSRGNEPNFTNVSYGGSGGAKEGLSSFSHAQWSYNYAESKGGTQTGGGIPTRNSSSTINGKFGEGGRYWSNYCGGGGGGWFGGSGGSYNGTGGGGGSSYALTKDSYKPSGYNVNSKYYLTDTVLISGDDYMPSTDTNKYLRDRGRTNGSSGYARITQLNYNYQTNASQTLSGNTNTSWTLAPGRYRLEAWGAQGNYNSSYQNRNYGKGGYASGEIEFDDFTTLYVRTGGQNGYNGGGSGGYSGGGATHFALRSGYLYDLYDYEESVLLVAGGGGGGQSNGSSYSNKTIPGGGNGNNYSKENGRRYTSNNSSYWVESGFDGSLTEGGEGGKSSQSYSYNGYPGTFGKGGNGYSSAGGGGGGWYGGGGGAYNGQSTSIYSCGGGGSNYVGSLKNASSQYNNREGSGYAKVTYLGPITSKNITNLNQPITFNFSAQEQEIILPAGKYELEAWGAGGGKDVYDRQYYNYRKQYSEYKEIEGGDGGYSYGQIELKEPTKLYIYTGGKGANAHYSSYGYYGGGVNGGYHGYYGGGGGGATHIALRQGQLKTFTNSEDEILLVAGGGGGSVIGSGSDGGYSSKGGYGGGEFAGDAFYNYNSSSSNDSINNRDYFITGASSYGPAYTVYDRNSYFSGILQESYRSRRGRNEYSNNSWTGGAGGGFWSGIVSRQSYVGGGGGSGYINEARVKNGFMKNGQQDMPTYRDRDLTMQGNDSNGFVKITPISQFNTPKGITTKVLKDFNYIGREETILLQPGYYKLEAWGAAGGTTEYSSYEQGLGGFGGYTSGYYNITEPTTLYINVGQKGRYGSGSHAYNGGGSSSTSYASGGGGATHIALRSGLLSNLENYKDSVLMVAGAGGGATRYGSSTYYSSCSDTEKCRENFYSQYVQAGGFGGGTIAGKGLATNSSGGTNYFSFPATTSEGGRRNNYDGNNSYEETTRGKFGRGGDGRSSAAGGGAGWYGGAGGSYSSYSSGSGGSSYVRKDIDNPELITGLQYQPHFNGMKQIKYDFRRINTPGNLSDGHVRISVVNKNKNILQKQFSNELLYDLNYTGREGTFTLQPGEYEMYLAGAQGRNYNVNQGGNGALIRTKFNLDRATTFYYNIGNQPRANSSDAGYNGGGSNGGGGATHIALRSGILPNLSGYKDDIIAVAGAGGGACYYSSTNYNVSTPGQGGYDGTPGNRLYPYTSSSYDQAYGGYGGNQFNGGQYGYGRNGSGHKGSFGQGGYSYSSYAGGGGAGWYGGGGGSRSSYNVTYYSAGGGGSSHVKDNFFSSVEYITGQNKGNGFIKIYKINKLKDGLYSPYNDIDLPTNVLDKDNVISITLKDINRTDLNDYQISKDTAIQCIPLLDWYLDPECTKKVDRNTKFSETTVLYTNSTTLPVSIEKYKDSFQKMMKIISSQPNKKEYAKLINANNTNGANVSFYNMKIIFDNEAGDIQFKEFLNGGMIPAFKELLNNVKVLSMFDESFSELRSNTITDDKLKNIILNSFNISETNLIKNLDKKHGSFMITIGENPNNPTLLQFSIDFDIQPTHQDYGHITFKQGNGRKPIAPIDIPVGTILTKEMLPQLVHSSWRIGNVNGPEAIGIQITEDLVLYEKFDNGEVTVKFKTANNRPAPNNIKVRYGTRLGSSGATLPQLQGSKWEYNGKDANGMLIGSNDIDGIPVSGDVTLVEKFTTNVHTISFYNPYSNDFMDDLVVSHGYKISSDILPTAVGGKWFYNGVDPTRSTVSVTQDITLVYSKENTNGNVTITTISRDGYSKSPITLPVGTVLSKSNLPDPNGVPKKFKQWVTNDKLKENPFEQPLYRNITIRMLYEGEF